MSQNYNYYNNDSGRDRGRSRERSDDRRGDGDNRSRSRQGQEEQGRGGSYDARRSRGNSYDQRSGSYEGRRGYQGQDNYDRGSSGSNRHGRSTGGFDRYARPTSAGHYGSSNANGGPNYYNRREVDSTYGPGSRHEPPRYRGSPDVSKITAVVTNILKAEVTEGFKFFVYSVNAENSSRDPIESRKRRQFLFNVGLWDGLLKGMGKNDKDDLRKMVFFNGSTFYSGREIPGLEPSKLPYEMEFGDRGEGDTMEIKKVEKKLAPIELQEAPRAELNPNEVRFDNRTENGRSFVSQAALLQHSQQTGNQIAVVPTDGTPATLEEFSAFVNSVLQSALGRKLS